jgi:hypothetical protein
MNIAALLLADPTFGLMTTAERREEAVALIASLGGEPDDDLGAALAVEEAEERFAAGETAQTAAQAPERPAGTEDHAPGCEGVQIAGNGRCLGCGAQTKSVAPFDHEADERARADRFMERIEAGETVSTMLADIRERDRAPQQAKSPQGGTLAAFKAATRMGDRDIADTIGLARSSVQAIVSGRAGENLTPKQLRALRAAAVEQQRALDDLVDSLEDRISG